MDALADRLDPLMQAYVDERGFAGLNVAVVHCRRTVFAGSFGRRDAEAALPMTADTIFRIYSMTKPIVAVAVMTLVEDGALALDDRVDRFLPAFGRLQVLSPGGELSDAVRPILVRDLLTHTGGFTNELQATAPAALYREARVHNDPTRTLEEFVDTIGALPLAFQPGTRWHYGTGLDVAGRLVELIVGQPLGDVLRRRIFDPLAMADTGFAVPGDRLGDLAAMYGAADVFARGLSLEAVAEAMADGVNRRLDVSSNHPTDAPDVFVRGGFGLYSTIGDVMRFSRMLVEGGELDGHRVLRPATVASMHRNHLPAELLPFELFGTTFPGRGFGLGSGVVVDIDAAGPPGSVGEHGWPGAAKTYSWVDPAEQLVGVLMAQYLFCPEAPELDLRAAVYDAIRN